MNQAVASRINGAKSNGPVTPEGRVISAQNSRTHGLTGGPVVLPNESQAKYDAFLASFVKRFRPADEYELDLVQEMANARWRLRRISEMESALIRTAINKQMGAMGEEADPDTAQMLAYADLSENSKGLRLLNRYAKDLRRSYEKALEEFMELRAAAEADEIVEPAEQEPDYSVLRNEPGARNEAFMKAIKPYFEKQQITLGHNAPAKVAA